MLAGCVAPGGPGVSRSAPAEGLVASSPRLEGSGQVVSPVIEALGARASVLPAGSGYAAVAQAVVDSSRGVAEAELRVARLTAQARAKNWLPSLGPEVNLSSLSSIAASLVLDAALLDNGRRKAERDHAAADVEVAAVTLAEEMNERVFRGLDLYIERQRGAELAGITEQALAKMDEFERIVGLRVDGGLSDRSEQRIIAQKAAELRIALTDDRRTAATAADELNALAGRDLTGINGLAALPPDTGSPEPLAVLRARGEGARMKAEARIARAGTLPGLGASVALEEGGDLSPNLRLGGTPFGAGTAATREALALTEEVADRKVAEAADEATRRLAAKANDIASLRAREAAQLAALRQMEGNLSLFTEQYRAGGRSLLELVGQHESFAALRRECASLKYDIARMELDIARERGTLVSGGAL
jgi:adhesin transport system outer membrane protein